VSVGGGAESGTMSTYDDDDDNIEFDFFDEPETVEATQRRRLPRLERPGGRGGGERPPRPPLRTPTGLVPLARLIGLIAVAIVVVVALVFWVDSCQGRSKHDEYSSYADQVKVLATSDTKLGQEFANEIGNGIKLSDLEAKLQQYAQQEQQEYNDALRIRPPGPLRSIHQNLIDAIELRYKGLAGLADVVATPNALKNQTDTTTKLVAQGELLIASDVVWAQLYQAPATQKLKDEAVTGVVIPSSAFVANTDIVSARAFPILLTRLSGASTSGTPTGKHGDGIVGVRVLPQGSDLTTSAATTVKVSADLSFLVTVEDSGDFQEVNVPVSLTIDLGAGQPIKKVEHISTIQAGQRQTVTFNGFQLPTAAFGRKATIKVEVAPVAGEINTSNNSASYTVFFTLS
jgi:hypothetical protein